MVRRHLTGLAGFDRRRRREKPDTPRVVDEAIRFFSTGGHGIESEISSFSRTGVGEGIPGWRLAPRSDSGREGKRERGSGHGRAHRTRFLALYTSRGTVICTVGIGINTEIDMRV
ncbi:hypothetical protein NL676_029079 [Syzygium grande]|nr:hypothetical protein NL676_029079 [Syzygium grande]